MVWSTGNSKRRRLIEPPPPPSMEPNGTNPTNYNNNIEVPSSHCLQIITTEVTHKVVAPPRRTTLQKLSSKFKEMFFPDDPLRQFKNQPFNKKLLLAAQYFFPIFQWGPTYSLSLFKSDIVSGLTIASLAIPQVTN